MDRGFFVLGLDGGGTETRCIIVHSSGRVIARGVGGPSNPITEGMRGAVKSIIEAVDGATKVSSLDRFRASTLGVAGTDRSSMRRQMAELLPEELGEISIVSDAESALAGATSCRPGVIAISGTGSIAYGINSEGRRARAGGWGWIVGDEGSGYSIGREAIRASLKAIDGRGRETGLVDRICKELELGGIEEIIEWVYSERRPHEIAALAPLVAEEASKGDEAGRKILRNAGSEMGEAVLAVTRRLNFEGRFNVAVNGGVFKMGGLFREAFMIRVRNGAPECLFISPRFKPDLGSALLALQRLGIEIDEVLLDRVEETRSERFYEENRSS
ncbi:MAG: BadF/BadG/BcrA/BcrD ATPase family protein [Candidatus Bathyarchaeia archaeon]